MRSSLFTKSPVYQRPRNERTIHETIRRSKIAVVYVYNQEPIGTRKYPGLRYSSVRRNAGQVLALQQSFISLSKSGYYPRGAVVFLQVNAATEAGKTFLHDHNLMNITLPGVLLFSDGVPVYDQNGPVVLTGSLSRQELKKKIDSYIDIDIAQYVEQERVCKRYEGIMRDRMHVYYSPYFSSVANPWNDYWGWPYYGMAQGNYGGNAGFVVGNGGMSFFGSNY
jgi:hypothetical protein